MLETLVLSILNHDSAIAAAAARMVTAAAGRPMIEMGSRRTHEARRGRGRPGGLPRRFRGHVQPGGRAPLRHPDRGHRRARLHAAARRRVGARSRARSRRSAPDTTLLVDTYDISRGHRSCAVAVAGPDLGAVRIDSGDLGDARRAGARPARLARRDRRPGSSCPATWTSTPSPRSRAEPVDAYGVGTSLVTGSGAPTAGWSTSWWRSTGGRSRSAAPRRSRAAAGSPRSAGSSRRARRSRRSCTRRRSRPRSGRTTGCCRCR